MGKKTSAKKTFKKTATSKKILHLDYIIAGILLAVFLFCAMVNGIHAIVTMNRLLELGIDISMASIPHPFDLDIFGILLGTWIIQLGISTGAYYIMCKSDHKIQLPMMLVNDLPKEIQDKVDMTQIITTVLSCTDN